MARNRLTRTATIGAVSLAVAVAVGLGVFRFFGSGSPSEEPTAAGSGLDVQEAVFAFPGADQAGKTPSHCTPPAETVVSKLAPPTTGPRAVIVDEASLTAPSPEFVDAATALLERAGYAVDYYAGSDVTVDLFRGLPAHDYGLLIFRSHSAPLFDDLVLFTSEPYSETAHIEDQKAGRLVRVHWDRGCGEEPRYFGVMPEFIESGMTGRFDDATVIITGCWGLRPDSTASAFVEKGADIVVGWNGLVSADHTDAATERLLEHLLIEELPTEEAVDQTMTEVGPDPDYDSVLLSYPPEG